MQYVYVGGAKNPVGSFCILVDHLVERFCGCAGGALYSGYKISQLIVFPVLKLIREKYGVAGDISTYTISTVPSTLFTINRISSQSVAKKIKGTF